MKRRWTRWSLGLWVTVVLLALPFHLTPARAGVNDVLLGVRSSADDPIDPGSVDAASFSTYFTNNGASSSLTLSGSNSGAMIGAIWTGGTSGTWRQMQVIIDSNGDGSFDPFDWADPSHPWNRPDNGTPNDPNDDPTSWDYTYPNDYPEADKRNTTITMTYDVASGQISGFPWDTFQWWWYEASYDRTDNWWVEAGQLMTTFWEGRDQEWNMLPNGDYTVKVRVDEDDSGTFDVGEAEQTLVITVQTAAITGTVQDSQGSPIAGAEVEAGSPLAWGQALTGTDGTFTVSGLQADAAYHLRVQAPGKVSAELDVTIPAGQTTTDAGTITLNDAVSITGTLKLDLDADGTLDEPEDQFQPFQNQWGWQQNDLPVWLDAWNMQGPGWGNGEALFQAGESSKAFTINIPPPGGTTTYQLNIHVEGYAASPTTVTVDATGGDAGSIILTKASVVTGTVKLPAPISEWRNIDVQAINTSNSEDRYWGWGQIDTSQGATDTGAFRIDGVPAGTFDLEIRVMGYATRTLHDVVIVQGEDKVLGEVAISEGSKITGTLTIQGDTTNLQRWEGDTEDPLHIWIDAWSPSGGWGGTDVEIARGTDQTAAYTVGGLSDGTYEIHGWIGEGYELVDENGNAPVIVTVSGTATKNITLKPHEGVVQGAISGPPALDLTKVVVEVKRPWDWLPPRFASVGNGGINTNSATFTVEGLGTGDYVVKAGMYEGYMDWNGQLQPLASYNGDGMLIPSPEVGVVVQRIFVKNDAAHPTTADITFEPGRTISGTISLSQTDPPWHDANGNGTEDLNADPQQSEAVSLDVDLVGQSVMAMPMDMMFMGGQDPRMGTINADGSFQIEGLAPGVYFVMPPFNSPRISNLSGGGNPQGDFFQGGEETHHWTVLPQMVVVTDSDVTGVDFVLGNGYSITGRLTLPEAQTVTQQWEEWEWVGHLELETPESGFLGHGKPVFKKDFNDTNRYDFTFHHVANGDYLVRFWTDRYVPAGAKVTVNSANASVNLTIEEGANLVGKLVDADTGEAITSADGVTVRCEAYPWVEGSYRETREDAWSQSYIEDESGLQGGQYGGQNGERENKTPGKFHLTALPTGHKYVIVVETEVGGNKTGGAKNYVGKVIAGIDIPEGATGDIDVGTIELKEGTTIKGRLTDASGNPIPGVEVIASPSDLHDGSAEAEGVSDTEGYYTVYGIDPEVDYYDLIAAERPFLFEDWGKTVEWGEKRKYNVAPGSTDVNFTLSRATATLSGTVTIPSAADFMLPFRGEGEEFPATYIIMQRRGVVYRDVLEGIEGMTVPRPSEATEATYTIDHIEPGVYRVFFMNYGLPTKVFENVTISDGSNTLDVTWSSAGYTVSGSVALETGGYPSSSDISGVVCMNTADQTLIFGQLTEEADGTYSAYEVPGLADGETYQLVFFKNTEMEGTPDIFPVGSPFTVNGADITDNTATITRNVEPILMVQAVQNPANPDQFNIGIFSTSYLVDASISVVNDLPTTDSTAGEIYVKTGSGSLSDVILSGDKRNISATYTKAAGDSTVELVLAVHYGDEATTKVETLSFSADAVAMNGDIVNTYTAGQVKLGNGDGSQIYIPAGAVDTTDAEKKVSVSIVESDEQPTTQGASLMTAAAGTGVFATSTATPLPSGVTAAGNQYDFNTSAVGGGTVSFQGAITVQIEYDPNQVTDTSALNVYHFVNGEWTLENTNRIVDTENHTISVEVTSLSPFIAGEGGTGSSSSTVSSSGGGGGCFISTAFSGLE